MDDYRTKALTRDKLASVFGNRPDVIKAFEDLQTDVGDLTPANIQALNNRVDAEVLGVFADETPEQVISAGFGVSVNRTANGYQVDVVPEFLVLALETYLDRQQPAPIIDASGIIAQSMFGE